MDNKFFQLPLVALTALLGFAPLVAADQATEPLAKQTEAFLQKIAAEAVRDGNWQEWTDWLNTSLTTEFSSSEIAADTSSVSQLLSRPRTTLALSQWRLLSITGPDHFQAVADKDGIEFLTWLFNNQEALNAYLGSGPLDQENTARGLEIWRDIFNKDRGSREGLWMRVAAATALSHTVPVKSLADGGEIDPLKRYLYFKNSQASGQLAPTFDKLATWELRYVVNSWARDEELAWVRDAMKPELRTQEKIGNAAYMVPYRGVNAKGVSVHSGAKYYDNKPVTLEAMHTIGGVCGAISKFGTASVQGFGIPAMPVGQPGHCAFLWKDSPTHWRTGNDIFGFPGSSQHGGIYIHWGNRASYVLLMEAAHRDPKKFLASEQVRWAAKLAGQNAIPLLQIAVKVQPLNAGAWQILTKKLAEDPSTTTETWQTAARSLMQAMPEHPLPLIDLLAPMEAHLDLKDGDTRTQYLKNVSSVIANGNAEAQQNCAQAAVTELVQRQATAVLPGGEKELNTLLNEKNPEGADKESSQKRLAVLDLVEAAMKASSNRSDIENALTGRYFAMMTSNPASLARTIKFYGGLFEVAKTNGDRKPAIALARKLILLAAKAENRPAMVKYSQECQKLLTEK